MVQISVSRLSTIYYTEHVMYVYNYTNTTEAHLAFSASTMLGPVPVKVAVPPILAA